METPEQEGCGSVGTPGGSTCEAAPLAPPACEFLWVSLFDRIYSDKEWWSIHFFRSVLRLFGRKCRSIWWLRHECMAANRRFNETCTMNKLTCWGAKSKGSTVLTWPSSSCVLSIWTRLMSRTSKYSPIVAKRILFRMGLAWAEDSTAVKGAPGNRDSLKLSSTR